MSLKSNLFLLSNCSELKILGAREEIEIRELLIDSRKVQNPSEALFFALKGPRRDGHAFIRQAYEKGVRNFVVSDVFDREGMENATIFQVPDVLNCLQEISTNHRAQFSIPVIAITGSNAKTIVKEWVFQTLGEQMNIVRSPKSYNSQIGVPLSVWKMNDTHELAVFEAGISVPGEMAVLEKILQPNIGIFTNIGAAHDEGFSGRAQKVEEKLALFQGVDTLICCKDHIEVFEAAFAKKIPLFAWSEHEQSDFCIRYESSKKALAVNFGGNQFLVPFAQEDAASIENVSHVIALLLYLKKSPQFIQKKIPFLKEIALRLELKAGINDCLIINDSYNADLDGLKIALEFLDQQGGPNDRGVILSDFFQHGQEATLYERIARLLNESQLKWVIGIGKEISSLAAFLSPEISFHLFPSTEVFLADFDLNQWLKTTLLLKGARQFEFEKIARALTLQRHETRLEIDLSGLVHNLNVFRNQLRENVKLMVMVKASAYGSGSLEVARVLAFQKVDYLAVAYADEGVLLRKGGIDLPILVLNPGENAMGTMMKYQLEPEIFSLSQLKRWIRFSKTLSDTIPIHLKLDTGMHRLGFEEEELVELISLLSANKPLNVVSLFSHMAASEVIGEDDFSTNQYSKFTRMCAKIEGALSLDANRHFLNSAGIIRFPEWQGQMVRLGIGVYGIDTSGALEGQLQAVFRMVTYISQIKTIEKGETIGYGRQGKAERRTRIATLSVGYADGIFRSAGNGAFSVWIDGTLAPVIGNVCMDMLMVDITESTNAIEGGEVVLFGPEYDIAHLAKACQTIPYEILTGISERVARVYLGE